MKNSIKKKIKNIFMFSLIGCLPITTTLLIGCSTTIQDNSNNNQGGDINNPSNPDNGGDNNQNPDGGGTDGGDNNGQNPDGGGTDGGDNNGQNPDGGGSDGGDNNGQNPDGGGSDGGNNGQNPPVDPTPPEQPLLPDPILEKYIEQFDQIFNKSTASTFENNVNNFKSLYLKTPLSTVNKDVANLLSTKIQFLEELEKIPGVTDLIVYNKNDGNQGRYYPINFNNQEDRNKIISSNEISYNSIDVNQKGEITFKLNVDLSPLDYKWFPTIKTKGTINPNPWTHKVTSKTIDISLNAKFNEFYFLTEPSRSYEEFMEKLSNISPQEQNSNKIFLGLIKSDDEIKLAFSSYFNINNEKHDKGTMTINFYNGIYLDIYNTTLFNNYYFELNLI